MHWLERRRTESNSFRIRRAAACLAVVTALFLLAQPAARAASDTERRLQDIEKEIEASRDRQESLEKQDTSLEREITAMRAAMIAAAKGAQQHEGALSALEERLARLNEEAKAKTANLTQRRGQLAVTLGALSRVARHPPEALIALPVPPSDTVRSAILLRAAIPALENEARKLRYELEAYADIRDRIANEQLALAGETTALAKERQRLDRLIERKRGLLQRTRKDTEAARKDASRLANEAKDLRDLLTRLAAQSKERAKKSRLTPNDRGSETVVLRAPPEPGQTFDQSRGRLPFPASGRLVRRYGEATDSGRTSSGIVIETRPGAQVITPHDGLVVFAGLFRGYGELLILEHGEGYHTLLSGLFRIDASVGQWLLTGEPVGVMGEAESGRTSLYIELRRASQPINPLPWLTARTSKVSG